VRLKNNMLEKIFLTVIEMSATASIAAVIVILLRLMAGRKLPRAFSYAAWAIVLIRLLIPFSMQSDFSLFNVVKLPNTGIEKAMEEPSGRKASTSGEKDAFFGITDASGKNYQSMAVIDEKDSNANEITNAKNGSNTNNVNANDNINDTVNSNDSLSHKISPFYVLACIWLSVFLILLVLCVFAYLKTSGRFRTAVLFDDNGLVEKCSGRLNIKRKIKIYVSDMTDTPVVSGIVNVRIIIPALLADCSSKELEHIISHELVHIKRYDYISKLLAILALCIHWFNPLVWLCFILYQKDMELSCDARVLSAYENDIRAEYANSLLNIAVKQNTLLQGGVLAFAESNVKGRIREIMNFRKKKIWLGIISAVLLCLIAVILLTNSQKDQVKSNVINNDTLSKFLEHRNKYIGNASNAGNLLNKLPYGRVKEGIELDTAGKPYKITINYRVDDIEATNEDNDTLKNVIPTLQNNALIIFSLIENVDIVKFNILPAGFSVQYERNQLQQFFEKPLWDYSGSKEEFEKFLLDINFSVFVYPERYSLAMSSVPGIYINMALNALYYSDVLHSVKLSTENGTFLTRNAGSGKILDLGKSVEFMFSDMSPVFWSPRDLDENVKENTVTISILDKHGNIIFSKRVVIEKGEDQSFSVKPSYDIIYESYNDYLTATGYQKE